jgi:outer membrane lipoprotein SlyB
LPRSNGTTGTIIGAGLGALIGRGIDSGHNRGAGTIIGALAGALLGRAAERSNAPVRCD